MKVILVLWCFSLLRLRTVLCPEDRTPTTKGLSVGWKLSVQDALRQVQSRLAFRSQSPENICRECVFRRYTARNLLGGVELPGVNLAGGEFGDIGSPMGKGYIYPSDDTFAYYASRGMRLVRLPFKMERVQPIAQGEFSRKDVKELDRCVKAAKAANMLIVLDAHNHGRRDGKTVTANDLANFWYRIAKRYEGAVHVALGLMDMPMTFSPKDWRAIVDETMTTLREAGSKHLVMVPGGGNSDAYDWIAKGNAAAFEGFQDSNFLFEVRQFLDFDGSGKHSHDYEHDAGAIRLIEFTDWARSRGYRAFLGAFGFAMPDGEIEGRKLLRFLRYNADVWRAYGYWAGGPWWGSDAFSIEPTRLGDKPQMELLREYSFIDGTVSWCDFPISRALSRSPSRSSSRSLIPPIPILKTPVRPKSKPLAKPSTRLLVPLPQSPPRKARALPMSRPQVLLGLAAGINVGVSPPVYKGGVTLPGVNLAGAEFGKIGDPMYVGYIYPSDDSFTYYAKKGLRLVRLPFSIERIQPEAMRDLLPTEMAHIDRCVIAARANNMLIVLDAHNYGRRYGQPIQAADLANFWYRIAMRYRGMVHVALGLMNEPEAIHPFDWRNIVDHTVKTLRDAGSEHLIMVPGGSWSGAHDWITKGNDQAFEGFSDSNFLFEVHQYFDGDYSGKNHHEYKQGSGSTSLKVFTEWARSKGYNAFLGEFGFAMPEGEAEARGVLNFLKANSDVWLAFSYWAGGPWWQNYPYSIEPMSGKDKPQMKILGEFL